MNLLVCLNGNAAEWQACFDPPRDQPRLPLAYAFGAAASQAGFALSGLDFSKSEPHGGDAGAFHKIYPAAEIDTAIANVDLALFWGTAGIRQCLREAVRPIDRRRIAFLTYGWREKGRFTPMRRASLLAARFAARFARCVIAMTAEQAEEARRCLPPYVKIVQLSVGIDTRFYGQPAQMSDVPAGERATVERLLQEPYAILPGDELRLNEDALDVVKATGLRLVRISQYAYKSGTNELKSEIAARGLSDRVEVFERISYAFLRFLLQHAAVYAGFVDATWQPAGWTVACESLASGVPLVMYDGYVARELKRLGIPEELCKVVPIGDRDAFARELLAISRLNRSESIASLGRKFAAERLNLEYTAPAFANALLSVMKGSN